jgi:hypothetical protein
MIGVLLTDAPINAFAPVAVFGLVNGVNLSNVMETGIDVSLIDYGAKLYLSASQNGRYTTVSPARPNAAIWVATVLKVNGNRTSCKLFINPVTERIDFGGGVQIFVQDDEPTTDISGDFWYDLTGPA